MTTAVSTTSAAVNPVQRMEELGRIILAYSELTEKMQQSQERLERTVHALRQELSEKNRLLERKNRLAALGEMAAGMAHEIRNPLGGIQLYASMLAGDVKDRPESLKLVQKISGGVKHLEGLVGQVLQFTREMRAVVGPMDLREVVEQAVGLAGDVMAKHGVVCELEGPERLEVMGDSRFVGQAVLNLVINGAEAMGEGAGARARGEGRGSTEEGAGGRVRVTFGTPVNGEAKQFVLVVQDDGPGLPADAMERIFNPFYTTKDTGTGLGLAIVHRVVEAHDGTIVAANAPEGGARFEIRI
jgi:signal transduction histidine kinase